jgi:2-iminobutanoate/2-iminopropanoate deaminase
MKRILHAVLPALSCVAVFALSACAVTSTTSAPASSAPHAMGHEVVASSGAPAAIGPYSQAIKSGPMLFLSGQIALDPKTGQMVGATIEEQARQVLENLKAVLAANGMSTDDVVATTVYVKDLNDFTKLNALYGTYFTSKPPARATVQVARLPRDALVEISAIAVK